MLPPAARERWDEFVTEAGGHLYQSWGWGELKARTGWTPWRVAWEEAGRICAGVSILARPVPGIGKSLLYAPRGPLLAAEQRPRLTDFLEGVCRLDVTRRALLLKLDPPVEAMQDWITPALAVCGFRAAPPAGMAFDGVQPRRVFQINLAPPVEELWRRLHERTRHDLRASERRGMRVREVESPGEVRTFYRLLRDTARRRGFLVRSEEYFQGVLTHLGARGQAQYFLAEVLGEAVAGGLALVVGRNCWYLYTGSSAAFALPRGHLLLWRILRWAKARGCTVCHLGGNPERAATAELLRFKTRFGATVVDYVGEFDYTASPVLYSAWTRLLPNVMRLWRAYGRRVAPTLA